MFRVNENYLKLPGSYLFSTIGKKVSAYETAHPEETVIRLGIGDVTQPLPPVVIEALHKAVDEMGNASTFHGYAPDLGYEFLRKAVAEKDFQARGCQITPDEIFVSDGAKSDSANIQEIFAADSKRLCTGAPEGAPGSDLPVLPQQSHRRDPDEGAAAGMGGLCQQRGLCDHF